MSVAICYILQKLRLSVGIFLVFLFFYYIGNDEESYVICGGDTGGFLV